MGGSSKVPRRISVAVALLLAMAALPACSTASAAGAPTSQNPAGLVEDPASVVNPFIGTGSGGPAVGNINTFPGPDVPFGMVQWGPVTNDPNPSQPLVGGYFSGATTMEGFSLTHLSGAGCPAYGDVPIMPYSGTPNLPPPESPSTYTSRFSDANEKATPGYYSVRMDNGITVALSVTARSGVGRFDFPAGKPPTLLFNIAGSETPVVTARAAVTGKFEIAGSVTTGGFCGHSGDYTLYFVARFNRPVAASGSWSELSMHHGARSVKAGTYGGLYVTFASCHCREQVGVQVGLSYTSIEGAEANLSAAHPGYDVESVAARAHALWNHYLDRIQIAGGTARERTLFYTMLYHSLLFPSVFSDANGRYMGLDGKIHVARSYPQYANFSEWDIYRSEIPLLALVAPKELAGMMQSLVRDAEQYGWLPTWEFADQNAGVMGGASADAILGDAVAFGVRSFNVNKAFDYMVKSFTTGGTEPGGQVETPGLTSYLQHGYVPDSAKITYDSASAEPDGASITLEYAEDDFAISQVAKALGATSSAGSDPARCAHVNESCSALESHYLALSGNWKNLYDPAAGEDVPRLANGSFLPGWPKGTRAVSRELALTGDGGVGQEGFQEGSSAQYTWLVPQDLAGLFQVMGGNAAVRKRLATYFTHLNAGPISPYDWDGNEQDLEVPWEGDYAGDPALTEDVVHRILTHSYSDSPGGEPGNDDLVPRPQVSHGQPWLSKYHRRNQDISAR